MAASNDFFVSFGSNAPAFTRQLAKDLGPAYTVITKFSDALAALDSQATTAIGNYSRAMAAGHKVAGGGATTGSDLDASRFNDAVDSMAGELTALKRSLHQVTLEMAKAAGSAKQAFANVSRSDKAKDQPYWTVPGTGTRRAKPGDPGAIYVDPRAQRQQGPTDTLLPLLQSKLNQLSQTPSLGQVSYSPAAAARWR